MKKIVYIAHPISGDVKNNLDRIKRIYTTISREVPEVVPFAPYWITCHALSDSIPSDREIGFAHNRAIFESGIINELWVFGYSKGVCEEIKWALDNNIPVIWKG